MRLVFRRIFQNDIIPTGNEIQQKCYAKCSSRFRSVDMSESQELPKKSYGQPTYYSHPHLLKEGEVLPGLRMEEFQERRQKLLSSILRTNPDSNHIVVIPSATKLFMTEMIPYPFRQNSDFLYLTGCLEPESALVMTVIPGEKCQSVLFLRDKDRNAEMWDGPRTGINDAPPFFGVDHALHMEDLKQYFSSFVNQYRNSTLWYEFIKPVQPKVDKKMRDILNYEWSKAWSSPRSFIHRLRLYKSDQEIEVMKTTCNIASEAISHTIANTHSGVTEHELYARVDFECRVRGATALAYPPVVAGAQRANIIHYVSNNQVLNKGEALLMDAGCEFSGYCSDITRTWPVSGEFSRSQAVLYDCLLEVQSELIKSLAVFPSLDSLFHIMCKAIGKKMIEFGVVSKNSRTDDCWNIGYSLCPHHVSHYLGMDVHDTPLIARSIQVEPRMIVTVEPGIYISCDNKMVMPEFRGIGMRIEDDILISESGAIVLTSKCPRSITELNSIQRVAG